MPFRALSASVLASAVGIGAAAVAVANAQPKTPGPAATVQAKPPTGTGTQPKASGSPAGAAKTPPAYVVIEATASDPNADLKLAQQITPTVRAFGGRFVVRRGRTVPFEGEPPKAIVIIAFDSMDKAQAWQDNPTRTDIELKRHQAGTVIRSYAVEALSQP